METSRGSGPSRRPSGVPSLTAIASRSKEPGLSVYAEAARSFPYLSAQDEETLARRAAAGDVAAAHRLAESHLRLVIRMARKQAWTGIPLGDLVSEGNVGLLVAIERFEPDRGFRLSTYAQWWIRATISEFVVRSFSLVRLGTSASQKRLFFNLGREKARLGALGSGDLKPADAAAIAESLGVPLDEVVSMNRRLAGDASLNVRVGSDEGEGSERMELLPDPSDSQEDRLLAADEEEWRRRLLGDAMGVLTDRERRVLVARRIAEETLTLEDLAGEFGVSRERIRQIEVKALEKVNAAVRRALAPANDAAPAIAA